MRAMARMFGLFPNSWSEMRHCDCRGAQFRKVA
jgi:hypothetical protein